MVSVKKNCWQRGYTLLELMLVMAVIAALMLIGVSAYQQQIANFQIDKTALQMQQWLQAGLSYYVDCAAVTPDTPWPTTRQLLGAEPNCHGTNVVYITNPNTPWGEAFEVLLVPTSSAGSGLTADFQVQAPIRNGYGPRIATRLPNAGMNPSTGYLFSRVSPPLKAMGVSPTTPTLLLIKEYHIVSSSYYLVKPDASNCIAPQVPVLHLSLSRFRGSRDYTQGKKGDYFTGLFGSIETKSEDATDPATGKPAWKISTNVYRNDETTTTNQYALAIVTCEAPEAKSEQQQTKPLSGFLF